MNTKLKNKEEVVMLAKRLWATDNVRYKDMALRLLITAGFSNKVIKYFLHCKETTIDKARNREKL